MDDHLISETVRQDLLLPNRTGPLDAISGGLSGAVIWRCQSKHGPAALRAWPTTHPTPTRLWQIHHAMRQARQAGLDFVPTIYRTSGNSSFLSDGKRLWELTQWMPGTADYLSARSDARLQAAMQALAKLHVALAPQSAVTKVSPTITDRIRQLQHLLGQARRYASHRTGNSLEDLLASETLRYLSQKGPLLLCELQRVASQAVPIQFVLRDIWSDHVLFTGDDVSGIIDFGAGRFDEITTDIARLISSLEPFDEGRRKLGLAYYRQVNSEIDEMRVDLFDRVATLLSATQWLQWLVIERREFNSPRLSLIQRWQQLLSRLASQR